MKIEVLFPEVCNLYGDLFNIKYLKKSLEEVEVIETSLTEEPAFISKDIDMLYMGPMTESMQLVVIKKLQPYKEKIEKLIQDGKVMLFTGNSMEVLENYIEDDDGTIYKGLGIINLYAKRDMLHRFNSLFLGTLKDENIKIMGHKATFSFSYGDNKGNYAFKSVRGIGINKESKYEGIRINNFFGTYLIGPILILNPEFTKYLIKLLGEEAKLAFEDKAEECYKIRLAEFEKDSTNYLQ